MAPHLTRYNYRGGGRGSVSGAQRQQLSQQRLNTHSVINGPSAAAVVQLAMSAVSSVLASDSTSAKAQSQSPVSGPELLLASQIGLPPPGSTNNATEAHPTGVDYEVALDSLPSSVAVSSSLDPVTLAKLMSDNSQTDNQSRIKRLPAPEVQPDEPQQPMQTQKKKKRNSNRMKVTNRKLYSANGFSLDPANDLLNGDDDYEDDEEGLADIEVDDEEEQEDEDEDEDDDEDENVVTRGRFGMGVLQKSLFGTSSSSSNSNNKEAHLNNNPSSPTTDLRFPQPPPPPSKQQQLLLPLDDNSREAVPLPGPPRDLIAQIVRPRFVTLSWMEPSKNPDEVVSYDVFYKMSTSER